MRRNLTIGDLGGFLDEPLVAVLGTLRMDGSVQLSPVWHRWREGGFDIWILIDDVKDRHLRRDPRASIVVAESRSPWRGVEVRTTARFIEEGVAEIANRIAARYVGQEKAIAYVASLAGQDLIVRLEPGELRIWDFADEI